MNILKENNQYYGKYFENAICDVINNNKIENKTGFSFPQQDISEMNEDAFLCAKFIRGNKATWVGNKTTKMNCDAIIDNVHTEIKYVSAGSGTYFNTSLEYLTTLGFPSYREYMKEDVYPFLEKYFGEKIYENISPVSQEESHWFRNTYPTEYKKLTTLDKKARTKYVSDLYTYFKNNPAILSRFISDCLSKKNSGKTPPDRLVIFNYRKKDCRIIDKDTILSLTQNKIFKKNQLSLIFDKLRISIGWQNGNGLNNPTLRVFIKG